MAKATVLSKTNEQWVCQASTGTSYTLSIDDEWREVQIRDASGKHVGEFEFKSLDEGGYKLMRMYCNGAKAGGIGRVVLQFFIDTVCDDVYVSQPDGMVRDDGSHLTEDAPGFVKKMITEGLIQGYR